jgi:phosphatidylserine/phosphatidylglycerophosphate/cardiolipin synthase-like enzyme
MYKNIFFKIIGKKNIKKILLISSSFFILFVTAYLIFFRNKSILVSGQYKNEPHFFYQSQDYFSGSIYFNKIGDDSDFVDLLKNTISQANETIDIAIYSFEHHELLALLDQKKQEGVKIRIVIPYSKKNQHDNFFRDHKFDIKTIGKNDEHFMHHKFIVVDGYTENPKVVFGSSNFTDIQMKYDPGFMMYSENLEFASFFLMEFERVYDQKYGFKKMFISNFNPFYYRGDYSNGFLEIWFSPGYKKNSVKYRKLELIENAEKNIKILSWRFNDRDIMKALLKKMEQGVDIYILADDYYFYDNSSVLWTLREKQNKLGMTNKVFSDSFYNLFFDLGILSKSDYLNEDFNSFFHHHAMIVDEQILVTGTNNWGFRGFYVNDESIIVTDIKDLVADFVLYFDYVYRDLVGENIDFEIKNEILKITNLLNEEFNLLVYTEKSYPHKRGEVCHFIEGVNNLDSYYIPKKCLKDNNRFYILQKDSRIFGSFYNL